jgi:hypothetical protein
MAKYTGTLYKRVNIDWYDALALSGNIVLLAVFYTFLGALVSFFLYYLFDEDSPDDNPPNHLEWEKHSLWYKAYDVCVEVSLIALISFWATYAINTSAEIIPVRAELSSFVDTYTTGMFFMFTVFIFMNDLSNKLIYLYKEVVGKQFDWLLPNEGSILDLSLRYGPRKTDEKKDDDKNHHGL